MGKNGQLEYTKIIEECKKYDKIAAQNGIHQVSFYSMLSLDSLIAEEKKTQALLKEAIKGLKAINKQLSRKK